MNNWNSFIPPVSFHPSITLSEELEELGINVVMFAARTNMPIESINEVINGQCAITSNMASAFEGVTGLPIHFWIQKQKNYDKTACSRSLI